MRASAKVGYNIRSMRKRRHFLQDLMILALSVGVAVAIVYFHLVPQLLAYLGDGVALASFVAGIFFTSVATTAPAIAVLGELSLQGNPLVVALFGGLGAVVGDYIIFVFVRDRVSDDVAYLLARTGTPRFFKIFHRRTFRWVLPLIGGLIIASPFPDELGLALLGVAKLPTSRFLMISFAFNTVGIVLIGLAARSLA